MSQRPKTKNISAPSPGVQPLTEPAGWRPEASRRVPGRDSPQAWALPRPRPPPAPPSRPPGPGRPSRPPPWR